MDQRLVDALLHTEVSTRPMRYRLVCAPPEMSDEEIDKMIEDSRNKMMTADVKSPNASKVVTKDIPKDKTKTDTKEVSPKS